jgi:hypothetical protein
MQTVSDKFMNFAEGGVQPLNWGLRISFDKQFDPDIGFFTLSDDSTPMSLLDGTDVLAPSDNNIINEWDKYDYRDYTDRVISLEVTREMIEPFSVVQTMADVTLKNEDNYFTPNSGSPIQDFILPRRPFRIFMGFDGESVPVFVGLSEKMPEIDKSAGTARFHLIDFLSVIFGKSVIEATMLINKTTSEILDVLFQQVGLVPDQYVLDTSFNRIPFFFVQKDDNLGQIIRDLMEAEQGRLFLDELGIIRFLNRQNYNETIVASYNKSNTLDYSVSGEDDIINYAKIKMDVLAVQDDQTVWQQSQPVAVEAGGTVEIWANLTDPVTSVLEPEYSPESVEASYFTTTRNADGTVPYTNISLENIESFGSAVKLTFENVGASDAFVFAIDLWGTPIKVIDTLLVEDKDQTSIDDFEEQVYELQTKYIQTKNDAINKAAIMVNDYKDYGSIVEYEVKGNPAYQLGDAHDLDLDGYQGAHIITKKIDIMANNRYTQTLRAKQKDIPSYFILSSDSEAKSLLDGTDLLTF